MKKKIPLIVRVLLGFVYFVAGLAGLLNLLPQPPDLPEALKTFNAGLAASVYFMPLLKATETLCGLMLLSGFFVPLALVILAPITLNILLVHAFLAPSGLPIALVIGLLHAYLAFIPEPYSRAIKLLFRPR